MSLKDALGFSTQSYEHTQQGNTPPRQVNSFGYSARIGTKEETVFGFSGLRTWESSAFAAEITSSHAGDNQKYEIVGLDGNLNWQVVTISINGKVHVPIPNVTWRDIFTIINRDSLTSSNAGRIDVFKAGDSGNPKARVLVGANQSTCGAMTIPRQYNAYLRRLAFSSSTENMQGRLYVDGRIQRQVTVSNTPFESIYDVMPFFPPESRLELRGEVVAGGGQGTLEGNFDIVLMRI